MMIETTVESIRVSLVTQQRVVILKAVEGERHLPIWIGAYEAEAIAMELQGITPTRPLPYDLIRSILLDIGATIDRVSIAELTDGVYYAKIQLDLNGRSMEIDSRPSDAIAVAVRFGLNIQVDESVMDEASVALDSEESGISSFPSDDEPGGIEQGSSSEGPSSGERSKAESDELNIFRDFINSLDLDDFDKKKKS